MHRRLLRLTDSTRLALAAGVLSGASAGLCSVLQAYLLSSTVDGVFLRHLDLAGVWPGLRLLLLVVAGRGGLIWLQEVASNEVATTIRPSAKCQTLSPARITPPLDSAIFRITGS